MPSSRYTFMRAEQGRAQLLIYGDIGEDFFAEESNDAKTVVEKLQQFDGLPVDVRISSEGGSVHDAIAIYNALQRHDVETYIDGFALSAGSLIAMAGKVVRMAENAQLMIHAPMTITGGNAVAHRSAADRLDGYAEALVTSYARGGKVSEQLVRDWLTDGQDHFLSAQEAQAMGFVDEVTPAVEIAASAKRFIKPDNGATMGGADMPENEKPTGGQTEKPEKAQDYVGDFRRARMEGTEDGRKAEAKRRKGVSEVFDGFADDPMSEASALMTACLDDINCEPDTANRRLLELLRTQSAPISMGGRRDGVPSPAPLVRHQAGGHTSVSMGAVQDEKVYSAMVDAVSHRMGVVKMSEDEAGQNPFVGLRIGELAREFAMQCGLSGVQMASSDRIIEKLMSPNVRLNVGPGSVLMAHSTGDFPAIFANVIDKAIRVRFAESAETWRQVARVGQVPDFKQASRPALSAFSDLDQVPEGGEYKQGTQSDVVEFLTAKKFGKIFSLTREMMINDDLQAMSDAASWMVQAANRKVGDEVWNVFLTNPTLNQDGTALFHANHGNIGTSGVPSVTTLGEARRLMRNQTDPSGNATLDLSPALLILPPVHETVGLSLVTAEQLDYELADASSNDLAQRRAQNQFRNLTPVVENRLGGTAGTDAVWWLQADPNGMVPLIEVAFVRGQEAPEVFSREGFDVDGIQYKVRQEFGVCALAYQPAVQNAGV